MPTDVLYYAYTIAVLYVRREYEEETMKIAMLLDQVVYPKVIHPLTQAQFQAMAELSVNQTKENEIENAARLIKDADFAVTSWGSPAMTARLLDQTPNLKLIAHAAGSVKSIVTDEMYRRGVRIVSAAKVLSTGVSETALGLTIASAKNLFALNEDTHRGGWSHDGVTEMYGITVGIIGFGLAGKHYAELLRPFSVEVIAYDPLVGAEAMAAVGARKVELEEVFTSSDILSLHAPQLDSTYHMVDRDRLESMKPGAILINTARGSLVDEAALADYLAAGKLKYACLDVTDPEPPALDSPLRKLPNCILTPHLAGQANNGLRKLGDFCLEQITHHLNGQPLAGEVRQEMLATIA